MTDRRRKPFYRRFWVWATCGLVLALAGTVTSIEMTSRSSFCNRCHIMNTYYASWETDVHSAVQCIECHIAPGMDNFVLAKLNGLGQVVDDWLNRTSTKPSASVSDFACMRSGCHGLDDLDTSGDDNGRSYFFDHATHLDIHYRGIAIHCTTCHSHVKGDRHFEVNTNTCITCHVAPGAPAHLEAAAAELVAPAGCDDCHAAPEHPFEYQGLTVDHNEFERFGASCESCHRGTTAPAAPVGDSQCLGCHDFGTERVTTAVDMHRVHTEGRHKVECFSCHGVTRHGPGAEAMSLSRFDCRSCHTGQHDVQRGTYLFKDELAHQQAADGVVSPMFLAHVDCTGCHIEAGPLSAKPSNGATVNRAVPAACDACHREGLGDQMIPLWQRTTRQLYDEVDALLPTPRDPWAAGVAAAQTRVDEARRLLELVRVDGSWGVHNPRYTQHLIEQARRKVVEARGLVPTLPSGGVSP